MDESSKFPFPQAEIDRLSERKWILDLVPKHSIGAEIGVFRGHFSEWIIRRVLPKKLFLVDLWTMQGTHYADYGDYTNFGTLPTSLAKEETAARTCNPIDSTEIVIVENTCSDFLANLEEQLDFAYLDTYHTFDETLDQLSAIEGRLASGGLILGDDWWADRSSHHHGVFLAVHEFMKSHHFEMLACGPGGQFCLRRGGSL